MKIKRNGMLTLLASTAVLAASGLGTGSADAAVGEYVIHRAVAAGACVRTTNQGTPVMGWDGLYNDSTSSVMYVDCALPGLYGNTSLGNPISYFRVRVTDSHTSQNVQCNIEFRTGLGALNYPSHGWSTSGVTGTAGGSLGGSYFNMGIRGQPYVSCLLPPKQNGKRSGINDFMMMGIVEGPP